MKIKAVDRVDFSGAAAVFVTKEQLRKKRFSFSNARIEKALNETHSEGHFQGNPGEHIPFISGRKAALFIGLGKKGEISLTRLRTIVKHAVAHSCFSKPDEIRIIPHDHSDRSVIAYTEGVLIGSYNWDKYVTPEKGKEKEKEKTVLLYTNKPELVHDTERVCEGVNLARDMVNENADIMNSERIERMVHDMARGKKGIRVFVLRRREMVKEGLNLHLAVNSGSRYEPRLIIVQYSHGGKGKYTSLIGKGITFDSGGLNLKPTGYIENMRFDKAGAAAVLGTLKAVMGLGLKVNCLFVLAVAENAIGKNAYKPGDVLKSYSGKTVEVSDTDAEGRLVLADANAYVSKKFRPARIINIATLTGAMEIALGNEYMGLFSSRQALAESLLLSAKETDDRAWQMPIYEELKEQVKSRYADIKNVGNSRGSAGALSAAEFLRQFAEGCDWAHLDIAATAFVTGSDRWYYHFGATGSGVRLLTHFLRHL